MAGVLLLGLAVGAAVGAPGGGEPTVAYREVYREAPFLMETLLHVVPVPNGLGFDDLVVLGRNYETREVRIHRVRWRRDGFELLWTSPNLFEWASPVAMAVGDFRGRGEREVAVATRSSVRLFRGAADGMEEVWSGPNPLGAAEEAVALAFRPGEPDRLGLTRTRRGEGVEAVKEVGWLSWTNRGWRRRAGTLTVPALRSLASARLEADGGTGLIVERGHGTGPGSVDVWRPGPGGLRRVTSQTLRPAAVFALGAGPVAHDGLAVNGTDGVAMGDNRGRVGLYRWKDDGTLEPLGEPIPVGWALTSVAVADVTGDGRGEVVVLGYPARLHLVAVVDR